MSVGKASIKRAVGADKKIEKTAVAVEAPVAEKKPAKAPAKKAATAKKAAPAKKAVPAAKKPTAEKKPAVPVKKTESKAKVGAVSLTEELPYYLL